MARKYGFLVTALSLLLLAGSVYGQVGATGASSGTVSDEKGAPVAKAVVKIMRAGSDSVVRELATDDSGNFTAALLPSGLYEISVTGSGFAESHVQQVPVSVTETTRLAVALPRPTAASDKTTEVVNVSIPVVRVETSNPTTGRSV